MRILEIDIKNFRNISHIVLEPSDTVNIIYGDNAQGKTRLLEAIFVITGQPAFRTRKSAALIQLSSSEAKLSARIFSGGREQLVAADIAKGIRYTLNEVEIHPNELAPRLSAVIFSPTEMKIVKGSPAEKRELMDSIISKLMPRYRSVLNSYLRAVRQRNTALLSYRQRLAPMELVEAATAVIFKPMQTIINARRRLLERLSVAAERIYSELCGNDGERLELIYRPSVATDNFEELARIFAQVLPADVESCTTSQGPHRDDIEILLNGLPIRSYGSQGQQRSAAISIKLAECRILEEVLYTPPILLLDDVFSELDEHRRSFFWRNTAESQIFITSCDNTGIGDTSTCKNIKISSGCVGF